jgi:hypothetical protein
MTITTIAGPFITHLQARETAEYLGNDCSVYYRYSKDVDGYDTDQAIYYVERNSDIPSGKIFGYDAAEFMKRQSK